mgnify:CR=1 FL=1
MNDRFIGFHQLVQKLEWITPIISTLQDKQNKRSLYNLYIGFHQLVQKLE